MSDFQIWGTVNQIGPREFVVIVSAVCEGDTDQSFLERALHKSRQEALAAQMELIAATAVKIRERGGRIVDMQYAE